MDTPIIYIIFRRPDLTIRSFASIRKARPKKLYVLADGPREGKAGEADKCAAARSITENIDWPCEVVRYYSDINLGCKDRIGGGLDMVFEREEKAIIVEDDCVPSFSFFPYCEEMLERFKNESKVCQISGLNVLWNRIQLADDIYFSKYPMCWGWATWANRWNQWDRDLSDWPISRNDDDFKSWLGNNNEWQYWESIFERMYTKTGPWDTWGYRWFYTAFKNQWLSVTPAKNLVQNIGIGNDSTHTSEANPSAQPPARSISPPYQFPKAIDLNTVADQLTFRTYFYYEEARPVQRTINAMKIFLGNLKQKLALKR